MDQQNSPMCGEKRDVIDAGSYPTDLLLLLPVCLGDDGQELLFESQASNGIEQWLENFSRVQVICPLLKGEDFRQAHSIVWKPVSQIAGAERVNFTPLPYATSLGSFSRAYLSGRAIIRQAIAGARYLCFAIGGLFGDWGAVACLEAQRLRRPYAVWTDRVEHQVSLITSGPHGSFRRVKANVRSRLMYHLERRCIRHASLGLFHGASCYAQYGPWCETPYLVQDFPMKDSDAIANDRLETKCREITNKAPLSIGYVGRADEMKGPLDWLDVMELLHERGVEFTATWLGDGSLLAEMRRAAEKRGLGGFVSLPGFVSSRAEVFEFLRASQLMVFCHKTPESPRCLVEALISGCPIVGYESEYVAELTDQGGGRLVGVGDKGRLVEELCALDADRTSLVTLAQAAVAAGKRINDTASFHYRSNLIKAHL